MYIFMVKFNPTKPIQEDLDMDLDNIVITQKFSNVLNIIKNDYP